MNFEEAAAKVKADGKKCDPQPSDQQLLALYGLYKQATEGDNNTEKPGFFAMKEKAKWEAWNSRKGLTKDQARTQYVAEAQKLLARVK